MSVADIIRRRTLTIRDTLSSLDEQLSRIEAQRDAAEDRVKRVTTEITRQRALEKEKKQLLNTSAEKIAEAQRILDDIEQKRSEALNSLIRFQDENYAANLSLREAKDETVTAENELRKEQKTKQDAETSLAKLRSDSTVKQAEFRNSLLEALDIYLEQQTEHINTVFSTHEQKVKVTQEIRDFKKARHEDPEIARLCDQRDEIRKFLNTAMVPDVKNMLQKSLKSIEDQIIKKFPMALQVSDTTFKDNQIEELLFFINSDGKAVFFLPVRENDWNAAEKGVITDSTSNTMCLIWNMIRELPLKTRDGKFITERGRVAFESCFDRDEIEILHEFNVKCKNAVVLRFVLSSVPDELQEAIIYED